MKKILLFISLLLTITSLAACKSEDAFFYGVFDVKFGQSLKFEKMRGVSAKSFLLGDITDQIKVSGDVDTSKLGTYTLTYSVLDGNKKTVEVKRKVQIVEQRNYYDFEHIESIRPFVNDKQSVIIYVYWDQCPYCDIIKINVLDWIEQNNNVKILFRTQDIHDEAKDLFNIKYLFVPGLLIIENGELKEFISDSHKVMEYINK